MKNENRVGPWFLSLHVYVVALFASIVNYANIPFAFASGTNFAYLLPFIIFIFAKKQLVFLPTIFFLITFLSFSSLLHHLKGCTSAQYRLLDYLSALLLFSFLILRALWSLLYFSAGWRFLLRTISVLTVGIVVGYYNNLAAHVDAVMVILGIVASALVLYDAYRQKRETRLSAIATTSLLACIATLGIAFNKSTDVWSDKSDVYDSKHGLWHLLIAQFLFVLIYIMLTIGRLETEYIAFGLTFAILIVLLSLLVSDSISNSSLFSVFLTNALFLAANWAFIIRFQIKQIADGGTKWILYPPKPLVLQFACDAESPE